MTYIILYNRLLEKYEVFDENGERLVGLYHLDILLKFGFRDVPLNSRAGQEILSKVQAKTTKVE